MTGLVGWLKRLFGTPAPGRAQPQAPAPEAAYEPIFPVPRAMRGAVPIEDASPNAADFFLVKSSSGTLVQVGQDGRLRTIAGAPVPPEASALAIRLRALPNTVFLLANAEDARPIHVDSDGLIAHALSFSLVAAEAEGRFHLKHPSRPFYICAAPGAPGEPVDLSCNRRQPSGWEVIELVPFVGSVTPLARTRIAAIARAFAEGAEASALADWLRSEPGSTVGELAHPVLRAAPESVMGQVAHMALSDGSLLQRLVDAFPKDRWFTEAMVDLASWMVDRPLVHRLRIGKELDFLVRECGEHRGTWTTGATMVTQARTRIEARRPLALLGTARNEGIYFLEWIAHYRAIGVDHVFIYSNDNNDGSDALLAALADAGEITWIENSFDRKIDGQVKAYAHHLSFSPYALDYRWTLVVDLDEFIVLDLDRYADLPTFLAAREAGGATAVAMSWMMFGPSRQLVWRPAPLIARFDVREATDNTAMKSAFLTRFALASQPHDPVFTPGAPIDFRNAAGDLHHWEGRDMPPSNGKPLYEHAWCNHYYFKSACEMLWKASRNRGGYELIDGLQAKPEALAAHAWWEKNDGPRDTRGKRHLPGLDRELARLRRLPGVAEAEAEVVRNFVEKVGQLRTEALTITNALPSDVAWKTDVLELLTATEHADRESFAGMVS